LKFIILADNFKISFVFVMIEKIFMDEEPVSPDRRKPERSLRLRKIIILGRWSRLLWAIDIFCNGSCLAKTEKQAKGLPVKCKTFY